MYLIIRVYLFLHVFTQVFISVFMFSCNICIHEFLHVLTCLFIYIRCACVRLGVFECWLVSGQISTLPQGFCRDLEIRI